MEQAMRVLFVLMCLCFVQCRPLIPITQTCNKTSYRTLCISILSGSRAKDVKQLAQAVIAKDLTVSKSAFYKAKDLFRGAGDRGSYERYATCMEQYNAAVSTHLPAVFKNLASANYNSAIGEMQSVATGSQVCQRQFAAGDPTPIANYNKHVYDLSMLAVEIIKMLE